MRLNEPRIDPLTESNWSDEARELLARFGRAPGGGRVLNIFRTLVHHPKLLKRWTVFGNHILFKSSLPARDREIAILRIGWLCNAEYEWGQHVVIGKREGLGDDEIARIAEGPEAEGWAPHERALLRATDELRADAMISDSTWKALADHYDTPQILDLLFTVGQYNLVSMVLNSCGVQLDEGIGGFRETVGRVPAES